MATTTATKTKETAVKTAAKKKAEVAPERYAYGVGRRKTAVAQVRLYPVAKAEETVVNGKSILTYFGTPGFVATALAPLKVVGLEEAFRVSVVVRGGGLNGQADAIKLGVARALLKHDIAHRPLLKAQGHLTRDSRAVERKKPGLKKARRAPQWAKR